VITQSTMAFATLLGAFSLVITQFQSISAFTAVTARLHLLSEAIEKAHRTTPCAITIEETPERVRYEHVTLHSADRSRVLVNDLNIEIQRGSRWLVTCAEDAPKVALFRATASVWDCGEGRITRPGLDDILFLPERPYLPPGTLREVLLRTGMESVTKDQEIQVLLHQLGLAEAVQRVGGLDADKDWDDVFSIGEQHMLSFARILLARPAFVLLDRPGSSLPKSQISIIMELLRSHGIGAIVLAKNGEARLHYQYVLEIRPDGAWQVHQETPAHEHEDHADLRDLSC
jgi:putative ATP-binding cassette transporter